jgi:hypothetical protein
MYPLASNRPCRSNTLNPVIRGRVSDALYAASIGKINADTRNYGRYYNTLIIHLIDSVSRGYTSPAEAWDALARDYFPIYLERRQSKYQNLLV